MLEDFSQFCTEHAYCSTAENFIRDCKTVQEMDLKLMKVRYVEVLTHMSKVVTAQDRPNVQHVVGCTRVDWRYEKLKCDRIFF